MSAIYFFWYICHIYLNKENKVIYFLSSASFLCYFIQVPLIVLIQQVLLYYKNQDNLCFNFFNNFKSHDSINALRILDTSQKKF